MHVRAQHRRWWVVAMGLAIAAWDRPAAAQQVLVQADGAANVGYIQTTNTRSQPADPNSQAADIPPQTVRSLFTDIRPGITIQSGSPRLTWRVGYLFSAALKVDQSQSLGYSNQANAAVIGEVSQFSILSANAAVAQGGPSFLLSQQPAELGKPEIRAPGNPNVITATLGQTLAWEVGRRLTLQQGLSGNLSAPQNAFDNGSSSLAGVLALDYLWGRDNVGLELRASNSWLQPARADLPSYTSSTTSLRARWNHDFSPAWNGLITAGIEQVYTDTGSKPLAFLPTGTASVRYAVGDIAGAVDFSHGTATNLRVGSVSLTDQITARGIITLDEFKLRVLSFSAGFLHNEPIGEVDAAVAAGTGNAVQVDAGFITAIARNLLLTARYTLGYQYGQANGVAPSTVHIFLVGVTGRLTNMPDDKRRMPRRGMRVDGGDSEGFPVVPGSQ